MNSQPALSRAALSRPDDRNYEGSMNDLITRIVNAVIRQEGETRFAQNPMNLRGAPWLPPGQPMLVGFWYPSSRAEGVAGGAHVVSLHIAQGNSLTDFIAGHPGVYAGFAPGADHNDDAAYIANVAAWAGIPDATAPLWNFIGEYLRLQTAK